MHTWKMASFKVPLSGSGIHLENTRGHYAHKVIYQMIVISLELAVSPGHSTIFNDINLINFILGYL